MTAQPAITADRRVHDEVAAHPYPLLFCTISGAHLYGFPSADSDLDLRGVHVLPLPEVVGLEPGPETVESMHVRAGLEVDLVTHDVRKYIELLLRRNGYVLEQLTSPLVVHTTPEHQELVALVPELVTRHHAHHYLGFAANQWKLFDKEQPRRVKPLLYVYRVLLTGIHLMQSGEVEANLLRLNERFRLAWIPELVARKVGGSERATLDDAETAVHAAHYQRLVGQLEQARDRSALPGSPAARPALHELLVRVRLGAGRRPSARPSAQPGTGAT
jgi:predicted nucleotidyltransferase